MPTAGFTCANTIPITAVDRDPGGLRSSRVCHQWLPVFREGSLDGLAGGCGRMFWLNRNMLPGSPQAPTRVFGLVAVHGVQARPEDGAGRLAAVHLLGPASLLSA
jgi:hypothetical protein